MLLVKCEFLHSQSTQSQQAWSACTVLYLDTQMTTRTWLGGVSHFFKSIFIVAKDMAQHHSSLKTTLDNNDITHVT